MEELTEEDFILFRENFIIITLTDGQKLMYPLTGRETLYLKDFFDNRTDRVPDKPNYKYFIYFSTVYDRQVFIRLSKISSVLFGYNVLPTTSPQYIDNFKAVVIDEEDNTQLIPDAIFKMKGKGGVLTYISLDDTDQHIGIDVLSMNDKNFVKHGFILVEDEDAEDNYIRVNEIVCCELSRKQVYLDEEWEDIQKAVLEEENNKTRSKQKI